MFKRFDMYSKKITHTIKYDEIIDLNSYIYEHITQIPKY